MASGQGAPAQVCNPQRAQGPGPLRGPQPPGDSSPGGPAAGLTLGSVVTPPLPPLALPMGPDGSPSPPRRRPSRSTEYWAGSALFPPGRIVPPAPWGCCRLGQSVPLPWSPAVGLSRPLRAPRPRSAPVGPLKPGASPSAGSLALLWPFGSASSTCGAAAGRGRWRPRALSARRPLGARAGARPSGALPGFRRPRGPSCSASAPTPSGPPPRTLQ